MGLGRKLGSKTEKSGACHTEVIERLAYENYCKKASRHLTFAEFALLLKCMRTRNRIEERSLTQSNMSTVVQNSMFSVHF